MTTRVFEDKEGTRTAGQLLLGIIGPGNSGKTFSALRLATGIQRVTGGEIYGVDSENNRMRHYAPEPGTPPGPLPFGKFRFRHVEFRSPFGPLDYLAAVEHCIAKGAKTIIVDSTSHEHEGPGGVLEMHDKETKRLAELWNKPEDKVQMTAWAKPKAERRRLINTLLQSPANFIFCWRAKEKLKIVPGKPPIEMGWQPQAGEEFIYEMLVNFLLMPQSDGWPTWKSEMPGEQMMIKVPEQFRGARVIGKQLTEDLGQYLAEWAAGITPKPRVTPAELVSRYSSARTIEDLKALEIERQAIWSAATKDEKLALKSASSAADAAVQPNHPANTTTISEEMSSK